MSGPDRRKFSEALGVRPVLMDAKEFGSMRRPRLYWCSWEIAAGERCKLVDHGDFEVKLYGFDMAPENWVEDGWCRSAAAKYMCTLTCRLSLIEQSRWSNKC